jgi:curli production assembly/transport component CsgG
MRIFKLSTIVLATAVLMGCASAVRPMGKIGIEDVPKVSETIQKEIDRLPAPDGPKIAVAVYGFKDMTGQRKNSTTLSLFSTAVTQGAESYLIKSLQEAGNRQWFTVVERVNLDNLLKERQMIKQTREIYDGANAKMLPPLALAGVILEGGIIDYNSNVLTGGTGFAVLGIGPYTQYMQDQVVISMRLVSVQTGEILTSVTIEKNLLSTKDGATAVRFYNQGTRSFEFDSSQTFNEPGNYALRSAIEQGIIELIKSGENLGLWKFKEASNELVQQKTKTEGTTQAPSTPSTQSSNGKVVGGSKESSSWNATDGSGNRIQTTK